MAITSKPIPGNQYLIIAGDRLDYIEKSAYGYIVGILESANPFLSGRNLSLENRPLIYPGEILNIPELPERKTLKTEQLKGKLSNKSKDELTILIGDREIKYISARLIRTMDTAADGCTCQIVRKYEDTDLENLLNPFSFPSAQVYIGNQLLLSGAVYSIAPNISDQGDLLNIEIWSYTADIIDSTMPAPYEQSNIILKDRADVLLKNIGIKSEFDFIDESPFDRVTADRTDTIFSHLAELASQRGFLLSSTIEGNLLFTKTKQSSPVGTLESGQVGTISLNAKFDGRKLFNTITAIGESPGNPNKKSSVINSNIPKSRFFTFKADDTTTGNIETAAKWKRSKILADSLKIPFPCKGFYAPNNTLYRENTRIIIKSKELFLPNGFEFLINRVEYVSENSGLSTILSLVPPTVYTGEEIILPWSA